MSPRALRRFCIALLLGLPLLPPVGAQQPSSSSQPQKEKPKAKAKKVWNDDDVSDVRKPWDTYSDQKMAAEQAAKAPEKAAASPAPAQVEPKGAEAKFNPPKTLEEAQARLTQKQDEIRGQEELIGRTREELFNAGDESLRAALQQKIDLLTKDLEDAKVELKLLEAKLDELKPKPTPQKPPQ